MKKQMNIAGIALVYDTTYLMMNRKEEEPPA